MRRAGLLLAVLVLSLSGKPPRAAASSGPPKLLVVLVVDQMRADYVDRFRGAWTGGLRRLIDRGAWFRHAAYPYMNTVTCPAHATIATGTFPSTHGLVLNEWWDRASGRRLACTSEPGSPVVSYGATEPGGHGLALRAAPALADEMRAQLREPPRVVTLSVKARSAIMLAGQGSVTTWLGSGAWVTSTAFSARPVPAVAEFVRANPIENSLGRVWRRLLPEAAYENEPATAGARPPKGWSTSWPKPIGHAGTTLDAETLELWRGSPYADAYLARMAGHLVERMRLGRGPGTDFLGVSFSALDTVGHDFGPRSHEVQDLLAHLDRTVGDLLAQLDRFVGSDHYVVALTSDHGVGLVPEPLAEIGLDAGRFRTVDIADRVNAALIPFLGAGRHVAAVLFTELYFAPGVYERLLAEPRALAAAMGAVESGPGVLRVYQREAVGAGRSSADPALRAAALGYYAGRSGDLIIVPKPHWYATGDATTHGTFYEYNARVPLFLLGRGIRPGTYYRPVTPADIAPTLARLSGVLLRQAEGHALEEALLDASRSTLPLDGNP